MKKKLLLLLVLILLPTLSVFAIDRRKPQFLNETSYMILPMPYAIPGIGSGLMGIGLAGNFLNSYTDLYAVNLSGDAQGTILGLEDIHLISETLIIDLYLQDLTRAAVQIYSQRGMNTLKDDYYLVEVDKVQSYQAQLRLSLFDRKFEAFARQWKQKVRIVNVLDAEGNSITGFSQEAEMQAGNAGFVVDYTDDWQDPRKGVRAWITRSESPPESNLSPDFYVMDVNLGFYIPMGQNSTWAFNYFTSDAVVTKEGQTDKAVIQSEVEASVTSSVCPTGAQACIDGVLADPTVQAIVTSQTELTWANRKYGTSTSLGGDSRFRAYPQSRFIGAHTLYLSTEIRWNFSTEVTPFNFWIWKDVSTGLQLAFFAERGSVADKKSDLTNNMRTTTGVGFRMVSASGYVYRIDLTNGDEGTQPSMIFNYPW
ncbi:MAG: hypothetical protein OEY59_11220 [Deltaproteobacteria bacterium]|nr:hypothetical protein [Deltaproteobacteria bacterium]